MLAPGEIQLEITAGDRENFVCGKQTFDFSFQTNAKICCSWYMILFLRSGFVSTWILFSPYPKLSLFYWQAINQNSNIPDPKPIWKYIMTFLIINLFNLVKLQNTLKRFVYPTHPTVIFMNEPEKDHQNLIDGKGIKKSFIWITLWILPERVEIHPKIDVWKADLWVSWKWRARDLYVDYKVKVIDYLQLR